MGWGSVQSGPVKLVEDNEALAVVGVVGHGHGNCGKWEASEIRVAYEGGDPFSLKGNTEALCERNTRRARSEEHTSELQSQSNLVCRLLLEKKKKANK